jgi:hypothetical protein
VLNSSGIPAPSEGAEVRLRQRVSGSLPELGVVKRSRRTDAGILVNVAWNSGATSEHMWGAPLPGVAVNLASLRAAQGRGRALSHVPAPCASPHAFLLICFQTLSRNRDHSLKPFIACPRFSCSKLSCPSTTGLRPLL